jgi:RNA polymerase sigma-70 factor (ECF subfamily)
MAPSNMTWPPSVPFEEALRRARTSDQQALSLLYRRFLPTVSRYILLRVGDPHHSEDLTADTFFAVVEGIASSRAADELGFAAWVLGIARNKVAMHFRRMRVRAESSHAFAADADLELLAVGDEDDPLTIITARESWATVTEALARLTEEQRSVVLYRCVLGYSTEDVATLLGKRAKAVRALQSRALASLARHLGLTIGAHRRASGQTDGMGQTGARGPALRR